MKEILLTILLPISLLTLSPLSETRACEVSADSIYLARHTDRGRTDFLTESGWSQALSLSNALDKAPINHIYVTEYPRTQQTTSIVAKAKGISPVVVPANSAVDLAKALCEHPDGDSILVVGHSHTIPRMLAELGFTEQEIEYCKMFLIREGGIEKLNFCELNGD